MVAPAVVATLTAAIVAAGVVSAAGAATAGDPTQTQPFLRWGDPAYYVLAPGGAMEPGSNSWLLAGGAAIVPGNEPYHVHSKTDSHSLSLPSGSSVGTKMVCI